MSSAADADAAAAAAADAPAAPEEDCGVKGMVDLQQHLDVRQCECLNESDAHPFSHALTSASAGGFLQSDCDAQLILSLTFTQAVKVHSLKLRCSTAPEHGPKTVRIFQNLPHTLDFDQADGMTPTQELTLTPSQLNGDPLPLRFVKFQNVQTLQFFFKDNQSGDDDTATQIDYFTVIGTPIGTTNMNEFKRVAGKKGEGH